MEKWRFHWVLLLSITTAPVRAHGKAKVSFSKRLVSDGLFGTFSENSSDLVAPPFPYFWHHNFFVLWAKAASFCGWLIKPMRLSMFLSDLTIVYSNENDRYTWNNYVSMMILRWTDNFWEVGWLHRFVLLLHNHSFQTRVWQKEPLLQPHWCKFWAGKTFTTLSGLVKQKQPIQSQGNCKTRSQVFLCFKVINCN